MSAENCTRKLLLITLAVALLWSITSIISRPTITISTDWGVKYHYQTRKIQEKFVPKLRNITKLNYVIIQVIITQMCFGNESYMYTIYCFADEFGV